MCTALNRTELITCLPEEEGGVHQLLKLRPTRSWQGHQVTSRRLNGQVSVRVEVYGKCMLSGFRSKDVVSFAGIPWTETEESIRIPCLGTPRKG
jgi:hypothetical protein